MLWFDVLLVFLWGGGAAAALSYCMNISRYNIVFGAIVGGLGWTVYSVTIAVGQSAGTQSYFWGALVVAILSEILALVQKKPATIYLVPGLLPLVPGGGMFETMEATVEGNLQEALLLGFSTLTSAGAIALAIALASSGKRIVVGIIGYLKGFKYLP
ncbi:MAG: threonine/serine exporter family protein [Spirochaetaceae bacterium]|nr:threonine/serine exporter family protein [Spirochaetaceae bacterium]MBR6566785.1 threonine/serine exporter family protein [Spirochaetaceae bacterium]